MMHNSPLSIFFLAVKNLRQKAFRTGCLLAVVLVLSGTLFAGSVITSSLKNGMTSIQQRLGSDIMVVPKGYEAQATGVLLKGEPSYFYFDASVAKTVAEVPGVSKVTTQFFLTSLSAECCSDQVQMIAFDSQTDFVILPWISKSYTEQLEEGQIIAGSDITLDQDKILKFFDRSYTVAAQLDKTATGLDASVFMSTKTMQQLLADAHKVGMNFISEGDPERSVSTVLVKIDPDADAEAVALQIRGAVSEGDVIVSQKMFSGISSSLRMLVKCIYILSASLWVFAAIVLTVVFSVMMNERKKEFAVFRILGATRHKLTLLVVLESLLICGGGGIAGTVLASLVVFPFSTYISDQLQMPYLQPELPVLLLRLGLSLLLTIAAGIFASVYSAVKISRAETYFILREGE